MEGKRLSIDITSSTILRVLVILIAVWFLYIILDILLMIFAAVVLASALEPVANFGQKYKLPRALSVGLVYILIILLFTGVGALLVQPLSAQISQLAAATPRVLDVLHQWVAFIPSYNAEAITSSVQDSLLGLSQNLTNIGADLFQQTRSVISGFVTVIFVFVLTFYLVIEKDALGKFARLVTPSEHLPYVERTIKRVQRQVGRWVAAQLALGVIMGLVVGLGLWLLGVPYALLLGIIAGLLEIIPYIGPIAAAIPGVVIALSSSLWLGLMALVLYIVAQQIEGHVLVPNIMRKAIGLPSLVTIIAILLGARLAGIPGIILAVPAATVLSVILSDLISSESSELAG